MSCLQHREYDLDKDTSYGGRIGGPIVAAHPEEREKMEKKWNKSARGTHASTLYRGISLIIRLATYLSCYTALCQ